MKRLQRLTFIVSILILLGCSGSIKQNVIDSAVQAHWQVTDNATPDPLRSKGASSHFIELASQIDKLPESEQIHYINVLDIGETALLARLNLIRSAKKSIDIQTYLFKGSHTGDLVLEELIAAAQRGVKVRVLIDSFFPIKNAHEAALISVYNRNLSFKLYNPTKTADTSKLARSWEMLTNFARANHRMHVKLMVVDGKVAITGGRNFGNEYFDWSDDFNFKDLDVIVVGPVLDKMIKSFEEYWKFDLSVSAFKRPDIAKELIAKDFEWVDLLKEIQYPQDLEQLSIDAGNKELVKSVLDPKTFKVEGQVDYWVDQPGRYIRPEGETEPSVIDRMRLLLNDIDEEFLVQTPYLILSKQARKNLAKAHEENPDIPFIISTTSCASNNHAHVYGLSYRQRKHILKKTGALVYELKPQPGDIGEMFPRYDRVMASRSTGDPAFRISLHSKALVIDKEIAWVGSHNFDPRSNDLNTECGLVVHDKAVADYVRNDILQLCEPQNSWVSARSRKWSTFAVWPFRYSSNFELKEGHSPKIRTDPDFYDNYIQVGNFPGVKKKTRIYLALFVSYFGGWATPLF